MLIEVKEGKKVISSREVEIKELNLLDKGKFLDLLHITLPCLLHF